MLRAAALALREIRKEEGQVYFSNLLIIGALVTTVSSQRDASLNREREHIIKEVRHELLMLPRINVFDNITFRVDGSTVVLEGQVTQPIAKDDAGGAVKGIEGVQRIDNKIEVLPLSPNDDRLRVALYRAIYGFNGLDRYALTVVKPIRIIVKNGHVTLEGIVANQADKNLAGIRANGVRGVFSVMNNLQIEK
jgi:hyperosmotically inducible protein